MNEMQDNELDDLFRKSLTDPEIPFDPGAWKAMESKLDADDRRRRGYFWLYAGVVAGIFLLVGSLYVVKQNNIQSVAQATKGNTIAAAQPPLTSENNTSADQPGVSTGSTVINNNNSNSLNSNATAQKADQETGASFTQEPSALASNQKTAASASQISRTKDRRIKNTAAGTAAERNKKYAGTQQQRTSDYSNTNTNNNTHTAIQQRRSKDAVAMDAVSAQQTASSDQQQYVAGNKKSIENNNTTEKNNSTEKSIPVEDNGSTVGEKNPVLSSDNRNSSSNADGTTAKSTTTTTTNNNNNTDADPLHTNRITNASVLQDTTQQHRDSDLTAESQNTILAREGTARKTADTLIIAAVDPLPAKTDSVTDADTSSTKEEIKKEPFKRGFSLSLILNPEYNSTVDFSFYKPNLNVGINVEYYILPRISLVSGIIYGQKLYTCDASDYASSPSYVRYGRTYYPDYVKASCGVLDIPVNVRYKFLNKKTFNVYASTGLSSYIMLKETYIFQYANKYRQDDEYQVHNKNRYLFNIWNVSFGVEKRINDKWSVQAEPYVKIPLNGVGAGDIKLVSTGVYFSLKYYFK